MDRFLGNPLKTPKNIFPTKSIIGYKMVPISILQMQISKILYFYIIYKKSPKNNPGSDFDHDPS